MSMKTMTVAAPTYLAITMNFWGRGANPAEAVKNMLAAGGRSSKARHGHVVVETDDPAAQIDGIDGSVLVHEGKTARVVDDRRKKKARR